MSTIMKQIITRLIGHYITNQNPNLFIMYKIFFVPKKKNQKRVDQWPKLAAAPIDNTFGGGFGSNLLK